jgi:GDP-L-fucose synthase
MTKIYVAGHTGLVGSAVMRRLEGSGNLLVRTIEQLDLRDQAAVNGFFEKERPDYVYLVAARVGGIYANSTYPAEFIYDNIIIEANVIHAAYQYGVKKLLFTGSSCIYPRIAPQPIREEYLLSGALEPTNEWYAVAKIAGIKMAQAYRRQYGFNAISAMPTNVYGPGDNFDLKTAHVLPAMIRKFHEAKISGETQVTIWGTGTPRREFLQVDDLADALVFLMENYDAEEIINVGTGEDLTILKLAEIVRDIVGYKGGMIFDRAMPDGAPRRVLDVSPLLSLGWRPKIPLQLGIETTYRWYQKVMAKQGDAFERSHNRQ